MQGELHRILGALGAANVRYVITGSVAAVLHGVPRLAPNLELQLDLEPANVGRALDALAALGFRPRAPVIAGGLADPAERQSWIDQGLRVLSLWSHGLPSTEVDLLLDPHPPYPMAELRSVPLAVDGIALRVLGLDDLILEFERSSRPLDQDTLSLLQSVSRMLRDEP